METADFIHSLLSTCNLSQILDDVMEVAVMNHDNSI